jgi:hypothetical protein
MNNYTPYEQTNPTRKWLYNYNRLHPSSSTMLKECQNVHKNKSRTKATNRKNATTQHASHQQHPYPNQSLSLFFSSHSSQSRCKPEAEAAVKGVSNESLEPGTLES